MRMSRREWLQAAAALGAAGSGLLWAPTAFGRAAAGGHDAYFSKLNDLLKRDGPGRPVMVVDVPRMNHNIDVIARSVGRQKTYRVVVKSLPSVPLLQHVLSRAGTNAMMVFHQPFLNAVAEAFPRADALLGKPMPIAAVRTYFARLDEHRYDSSARVQWLIDTPERLLQYQALARQLGTRMRVNLEIDVGLHRGGFPEPAALDPVLAVIRNDPRHLSLAGLMGYEAHLTGLKADLQHPAVQNVLARYRGFIDRIRDGGFAPDGMTLNGAGSHTLRIYERDATMNDLAAGSGVVKPADFDTFHLADNVPALFIATPILKRYEGNPFMEDPPADMARLYYIYGGYWKARMVSPTHIGKPLYESTNQSPVTTSRDVDLHVDDYMFLRPTQSEFVMLQFGDLLAVEGGRISARWPVFQQTG